MFTLWITVRSVSACFLWSEDFEAASLGHIEMLRLPVTTQTFNCLDVLLGLIQREAEIGIWQGFLRHRLNVNSTSSGDLKDNNCSFFTRDFSSWVAESHQCIAGFAIPPNLSTPSLSSYLCILTHHTPVLLRYPWAARLSYVSCLLQVGHGTIIQQNSVARLKLQSLRQSSERSAWRLTALFFFTFPYRVCNKFCVTGWNKFSVWFSSSKPLALLCCSWISKKSTRPQIAPCLAVHHRSLGAKSRWKLAWLEHEHRTVPTAIWLQKDVSSEYWACI